MEGCSKIITISFLLSKLCEDPYFMTIWVSCFKFCVRNFMNALVHLLQIMRKLPGLFHSEAVFLVMCDPPMNEL
jgi:hypothetical protein